MDWKPQAAFTRAYGWIKGRLAVAKSGISSNVRAATSSAIRGIRTDGLAEAAQYGGWNYLAIQAVAKQASQATVAAYVGRDQDSGDEGQPLPSSHRLLRLLNRPSPWQSGSLFRFEQVMHLELTGACVVWKIRNKLGQTVRRIVVPKDCLSPYGYSPEFPNGAVRISRIDPRRNPWHAFSLYAQHFAAMGLVVPAEDLMVIRYPHPTAIDEGYAPSTAGASWLDTAAMIDRARHSHMRRGANPSLIVEPPDDVDLTQDDLNRHQERLNLLYGGADNVGKIMVAQHGKVTKVSQTAEEMSYDSGFEQMGNAVLALHGVSRAVCGMQDSMTYGGIAAAFHGFGFTTVGPILRLLADEETAQQAPEFGENITVELTAKTLDDPELGERQLANDLNSGAITKREYREKRGLKPFGDARDNQIAGPLGDIQGAMAGAVMQAVTRPAGGDQAGSPVIVNSVPPETPPGQAAVGPAVGQPETGGQGEPSGSVAAVNLNGAQITAAKGVTDGVASGQTNPVVAVELLVAMGIDRATADLMVKASAASSGTAQAVQKSSLAKSGAGTTPAATTSSGDSRRPVVAIDLDGTLAQYDGWNGDEIGEPKPGAREFMQALRNRGYVLTVFTVRGDQDAIANWLNAHQIPFDFINDSPGQDETMSGKVLADAYFDDHSVTAGSDLMEGLPRLIAAVEQATGYKPPKLSEDGHRYGCLLATMPAGLYQEVAVLHELIDPEDLAADGLELEPHVTVLYGLVADDPGPVAAMLSGMSAFPIQINGASCFEDDGKRGFDVLKLTITSDELMQLNAYLRANLPHVQTHSTYQPHLTIAYLKPGAAAKYLEMEPFRISGEVTVTSIKFTRTDGTSVVIPLKFGELAKSLSKPRLSDVPSESRWWEKLSVKSKS